MKKLTTKFAVVNDEDVINKTYLDTKLSKIECQNSYIGKNYHE